MRQLCLLIKIFLEENIFLNRLCWNSTNLINIYLIWVDSIAPKIFLKYLLEHFTQSLLPANKGLIFQICIYRKVTIFSKVEVGSYSVGSYLFSPLAKKMIKYSLSKRQSKNRKYHKKVPLNVLLDRFLIWKNSVI